MIKKIAAIALLIFMAASVSGCYSYVGLNRMSIVAGVGVDITQDGNFELSFEVVDVSNSSKDRGLKSLIIKSQGRTLFDAIRNARNQLPTKLYFGNNSLIVICKKVAEENGIFSVMDFFIRDEECRETVHMVVSDKEKAADIMESKGLLSNITSYGIHKMIDDDVKYAGSVYSMELYKIYNLLLEDRQQIFLPLLTTAGEGEAEHVIINGMAIFKKGKLIKQFGIEDSKYSLFAADQKKGGIITLDVGGNRILSLEIFKTDTKINFVEEGGNIRFSIKTETQVFIGEDPKTKESFTIGDIAEIEKATEENLRQNIEDVIKKTQTDNPSDIYGYSSLIFKKNPKLWKKIKDDWDNIFAQIETDVECKVKVLNTGYIK